MKLERILEVGLVQADDVTLIQHQCQKRRTTECWSAYQKHRLYRKPHGLKKLQVPIEHFNGVPMRIEVFVRTIRMTMS